MHAELGRCKTTDARDWIQMEGERHVWPESGHFQSPGPRVCIALCVCVCAREAPGREWNEES